VLDVEVDSKGNIYVADWGTKRIRKFSPEGKFLLSIGRAGQGPGEFAPVFSMELDKWDNIYVSDGINARIQKFSSEGKFLKSMKVFINDLNDFEIIDDKIYYRISFPQKGLLAESDTSLTYSREILPIDPAIKKDFENARLTSLSFTVLPNKTFIFFNSITKKFYKLDQNGKLINSYDINCKKLLNLMDKNKEIYDKRDRERKKIKSNVVAKSISKFPIFTNINVFDNFIYAMATKIIEFGNSLECENILYQIDTKGNFLREYIGFKNSHKTFTIDKDGFIFAFEWDEAKVSKYKKIKINRKGVYNE